MPRQHTIELYTFEELDPKAKERARDWYREVSANDPYYNETIIEAFTYDLAELGYPTNKIGFSLGHVQGDGVEFYGRCNSGIIIERFNRDGSGSQIPDHARLNANITQVGRDSMHVTVELYIDGISDDEVAVLEDDLTAWLKEDIYQVSNKLRQEGYDIIQDHDSNEFVDETIMANDYEFYASGKRADV